MGALRVLALLFCTVLTAGRGADILKRVAEEDHKRTATSADVKALDEMSKQGVQVFAAMAEAFLHRGSLTKKETNCLLVRVENVTHLIYEASADIAAAFSALLQPGDEGLADAVVKVAEVALLVPQLEESLDRLLVLLGGFLGPCLGHSAERAAQRAAAHLGNLSYVAGHLRANGADIVHEMASAVKAFQAADLRSFGRGMGRVCRKVLLSKKGSAALPEGAPTLPQLVNLSAGVLRGFFGEGFELDLSLGPHAEDAKASPEATSTFTVARDDEGVQRMRLHVDLHKCVEANLLDFQKAALSAVMPLAQEDLEEEEVEDAVLPALLASGLEEAPTVLRRCGIRKEQEETLITALLALDHMRMGVKLPSSASRLDGLVEQLEHAADDWKKLDWFALGEDLGELLLQLLVQIFPQKYSIDGAGVLRKKLAEAAGVVHPLPLLALSAVPLVGMATAFRSLRARRAPAAEEDQDLLAVE